MVLWPCIIDRDFFSRSQLTIPIAIVGLAANIKQDIYGLISKADLASASSYWDERVMGNWNVRCYTVMIVQTLAIWKDGDIHKVFMDWVQGLRPGIDAI